MPRWLAYSAATSQISIGERKLVTHINVSRGADCGVTSASVAVMVASRRDFQVILSGSASPDAVIRGSPSFVEDKAINIVGDVGERDLRLGPRDADGADEQSHLISRPANCITTIGAAFRWPIGMALATEVEVADGT